MKLGFTGTSRRMKAVQSDSMACELLRLEYTEFHHGDCVNADEEAHNVVGALTLAQIVIHPPLDSKARAFCINDSPAGRVVERPPKPYLDRNHDIVDETDVLLACPRSSKEQLRGSGSWATIRYARRLKRPITIIHPDGRITHENW